MDPQEKIAPVINFLELKLRALDTQAEETFNPHKLLDISLEKARINSFYKSSGALVGDSVAHSLSGVTRCRRV